MLNAYLFENNYKLSFIKINKRFYNLFKRKRYIFKNNIKGIIGYKSFKSNNDILILKLSIYI
jgi:hypothetical protein